MNRITDRLGQLKARGEKAFITYITAGLPELDKTADIIRAQAEAGVDVIELGIPFSDPVADGPVIQDASYRSILKGTNLVKCFDIVTDVRTDCEVPIVFMMYYNTILHYGLAAFADKCIEIGVDGIIVPDLPYEEQSELRSVLSEREGAPKLIPLVSPVSKNRLPKLLDGAEGFVYCVSSMGVTGQAADFHKNVKAYLEEVKAETDIPVMMGFGIRTAADVAMLKNTIDGCIVGSHFIRLMEENAYSTDKIQEYIRTFKQELNA